MEKPSVRDIRVADRGADGSKRRDRRHSRQVPDGDSRRRDLGLNRLTHAGGDPRWLNVWDRHDVLSYPVRPFCHGGEIVDIYPDHSDSLLGSHEAYWTSPAVHRRLAEEWE